MTYIPQSGSIVSYQGGPWLAGMGLLKESSSVVAVMPGSLKENSSILAHVVSMPPVVIVGSVITIAPANQSVSGAVSVSNFPTNQNVSGSVVSFQGGIWGITGSVQGFPVNQSVSGTLGSSIIGLTPVNVANTNLNVGGSVVSFQAGVNITSLVSTVPSSVLVGASIFGTVPVTQSGVQVTSILGNFAEDVAHTTGDFGVFVLGVRNDTLSSVTSTDGDYTPLVVGPAGENIVANAPLTKWVFGQTSIFTGVTQPIIAAQGASIFTYITSFQIGNTSANVARVKFMNAAAGVVLGHLVIGANTQVGYTMPNGWKTAENAAFSGSISGVASVFVTAQGFISKI